MNRTFFGAIFQAFTSDRFGRKGSILGWSFIFTIGTVIQTASVNSYGQISAGRFIAGLGVGALSGTKVIESPLRSHLTFLSLSAIVPLYNGETAPKALRGTL